VEDKIKRAFKKISVLYPTPDEDSGNSNSGNTIMDVKRQPLRAFVVVGGVASNQELRRYVYVFTSQSILYAYLLTRHFCMKAIIEFIIEARATSASYLPPGFLLH
jgi:tRNA A37 threonylcarbamoyltransferase TsaD